MTPEKRFERMMGFARADKLYTSDKRREMEIERKRLKQPAIDLDLEAQKFKDHWISSAALAFCLAMG